MGVFFVAGLDGKAFAQGLARFDFFRAWGLHS